MPQFTLEPKLARQVRTRPPVTLRPEVKRFIYNLGPEGTYHLTLTRRDTPPPNYQSLTMAEGGNPVEPDPTAPESLEDLFTNQLSDNPGEGAAGQKPTVPQPQGNLGFPTNQQVPPLVSSPNQPVPTLVVTPPPTAPTSVHLTTGTIPKVTMPGNRGNGVAPNEQATPPPPQHENLGNFTGHFTPQGREMMGNLYDAKAKIVEEK